MNIQTMTTQSFKVVNDSSVASGACLRGYVTTTYNVLVEKLGMPKNGSADGKTTAEWILSFEDGTVATIYDWRSNLTPKDLYKWHIGGKGISVLDKVKQALGIETQTDTF